MDNEEKKLIDETQIAWISEIMARVAYYNMTGEGEEPSEFEKRLAEKEMDRLLQSLSK